MMAEESIEESPFGRYIKFSDRLLHSTRYEEIYDAFDQEEGVEMAWNQVKAGTLTNDQQKKFFEILQLHQTLSHPNIVHVYSAWIDPKSNTIVYITEPLPSGSLKKYLSRSKQVKLPIIKRWCKQILEAVHYYHGHMPPIIHSNIDLEHIFIKGKLSKVKLKVSVLSRVLPLPIANQDDICIDIGSIAICLMKMVKISAADNIVSNCSERNRAILAGKSERDLPEETPEEVKTFIELCFSSDIKQLHASDLLASAFFSHGVALAPSESSGNLSLQVDSYHASLQAPISASPRTPSPTPPASTPISTPISTPVSTPLATPASTPQNTIYSPINFVEQHAQHNAHGFWRRTSVPDTIPESPSGPVFNIIDKDDDTRVNPELAFLHQHTTNNIETHNVIIKYETDAGSPSPKSYRTQLITRDILSNHTLASPNASTKKVESLVLSKSSNPKKTFAPGVVLTESNDKDAITVILFLQTQAGRKEVNFLFDPAFDTPDSIAAEMVNALELDEYEKDNIAWNLQRLLHGLPSDTAETVEDETAGDEADQDQEEQDADGDVEEEDSDSYQLSDDGSSGGRIDWEIDPDELTISKEFLGGGSFGSVYKAKWRGIEVAVKKLNLKKITQNNNEKHIQSLLKDFIKEAQLLSKLRHTNVLQFFGACTQYPKLYIVTEYMPNGSLYRLIHDRRMLKRLDMELLVKFAQDIALGMNYLHLCRPKKIIHRDLKSLNLLVGDNMSKVVVADFGFARVKEENATMTVNIGTVQWMAPEVMLGGDYTEKADVYSYGIVLWEMLTRQIPFDKMDKNKIIQLVTTMNKRLMIPKHCSPGLTTLIQDCWHADSSKRPSFAEILVSLDQIKQELEIPKPKLMGKYHTL